MSVYINAQQLNIVYSSRKTISIEIKQGGILVRAPIGMSRYKIDLFLYEKRTWIEKHLSKLQEQKSVLEHMGHFTMEEIRTLGDKALVVVPEKVCICNWCYIWTHHHPKPTLSLGKLF